MSAKNALELRNVRQSYTHAPPWILNDFSAAIPAGSITAILGPNGVGKTTLLHVLLGILSVQSGEVLVDEQPLVNVHHQVRSRWIGLVPQRETLPFPLTAFEYMLMGRAPYLGLLGRPGKEDSACVEAVMDRLGLSALWDRPVPELSGGEAQLIRIARALVQEPRILLLDEPTAHLDLKNQACVLEALANISAQENKTVVFTTHDPDTALTVASDAILMRAGKVHARGPALRILNEENLSLAYGLPLRVREVEGQPVVLRKNHIP